jgi:hypothetical protein
MKSSTALSANPARNLRIALKVLKRRYGLRMVTIRETLH